MSTTDIQLLSATVLKGNGADKILIKTNLPEACWPYQGNLHLQFSAAAGSGINYVFEHFGLTPMVISV